MTLFAIYRDDVFVEKREFAERPVMPHKPQLKFYEVITVNPPHDSATQHKTGPVITLDHTPGAETHTETWTVTDKTAQEIDDEKTARATELSATTDMKMARLVFATLFDIVNQHRVAHGQAALTQNQFATYLDGLPLPSMANFIARIKTVL